MDINRPFTNADVLISLRRAAGLPDRPAEPVFAEEEPASPPRWNNRPGPGRRGKTDPQPR